MSTTLGKKITGYPQTQAQMAEWQSKYVYDKATGSWYEKGTAPAPTPTPAPTPASTSLNDFIKSQGYNPNAIDATEKKEFERMYTEQQSKTVAPVAPVSNISPTAPTPASTPTAEPITVNKEEIVSWLRQQPKYNSLPKDLQDDLIAYIDIGLGPQDIESQKKILSALNLAVAQADPYFAEIIRMAKDELSRSIGITTEDYESQQRDIQERIKQLQEDLSTSTGRLDTDKQVELTRLQSQYDELEISKGIAGDDFASQEKRLEEQIKRIGEDLETGKGRLSVDEQAELARLGRSYEVNLEGLREGAARTGLTFSSRRALAEQRLETEHEDIVESTKRNFQRQLQDLEVRAERGDMDAKKQLEDYERQYGETVSRITRQQGQYTGDTGFLATTTEAFRRQLQDLQTQASRGSVDAQNKLKDLTTKHGRSIQDLGRTAEGYLGTEKMGTLAGYAPLGGVRGKIEEDKLGDIMSRASLYGGF